jgi:hypothetical protein
MPPRDRTHPHPTRADVDARIGETFLALNQIAASLALVEKTCSRMVDVLPVDDDAVLDQIGDVSDTLTTVLRFLSQQKARTADECVSLAGECYGGN